MRCEIEEVLKKLRYKKKSTNEYIGIKDGIMSVCEIQENKVKINMMVITDNIDDKASTLLQIELNKLERKLNTIGLKVKPCGYASIPNGTGMFLVIPINNKVDLNKIVNFSVGMKDELLKIIKKLNI